MEEDKTSTVVSESIVVNEENSNNNDDDDNNALVERVAGEEAEVEEAEAETELGGGDNGAVVVGDTGPEELTGLELVAVKKNNTRGPPRKYDVDGGGDDMVVGPVLLPPGSSSESATKRRRGRPRGSGKLQLIASLGEFLALQENTEKLLFLLLFLFDMNYDCLMCMVLVILRCCCGCCLLLLFDLFSIYWKFFE